MVLRAKSNATLDLIKFKSYHVWLDLVQNLTGQREERSKHSKELKEESLGVKSRYFITGGRWPTGPGA